MANIIITVPQNHICIYRSRDGSDFNVYYPSTTTTITDYYGGEIEIINLDNFPVSRPSVMTSDEVNTLRGYNEQWVEEESDFTIWYTNEKYHYFYDTVSEQGSWSMVWTGCNGKYRTIRQSDYLSEFTLSSISAINTSKIVSIEYWPNTITEMQFSGCHHLRKIPTIFPTSLIHMNNTFNGCYSLTNSEGFIIPSGVQNMDTAFNGCTSLTGAIQINANPESYGDCFFETKFPIYLCGNSNLLSSIAATSTNSNVTVVSTLAGTQWTFIDNITSFSNISGNLNYVINNTSYTSISISKNNNISINATNSSGTTNLYNNSWVLDSYRTIEIVGGSLCTNNNFITWLYSNSTPYFGNTIYWSYDSATTSLKISSSQLPTTTNNGSFSLYAPLLDDVQTKHFLSDGTYVETGGELYVPWGNYTSSITSVSVSNLSPIYMDEWFDGGSNITTWNFSNVFFSNCVSFKFTFQLCNSVPDVLCIMCTKAATTLRGTFYSYTGTYLELNSWDTSNVTSLYRVFFNCANITQLDLSSWDTSSVIDMSQTFNQLLSATSLDVSTWDTSNATTFYCTFRRCEVVKNLDVSNWDTSNVTNMAQTFNGVNSILELDLSGWNTSKVTTLNSTFSSYYTTTPEKQLASLDVSTWDTSNVTDMSSSFFGCRNLRSLDISNWDTSSVTTMCKMFYSADKTSGMKLLHLNVSNWDVSNVQDMSYLFYGCENLSELNVANWNTSSVTNLYATFYNCYGISYLPIENWDTSNVVNMSAVFGNYPYGLSTLKSIDLSRWNTSKVTDMSLLFQQCNLLSDVKLSGIDTSKVTTFKNLFYRCENLSELDLMSFDTSSCTNTDYAFYKCSTLRTINIGVKEWDISNVTSSTNMFLNCNNLIGAISYDANNIDVNYANSTTGYFTNPELNSSLVVKTSNNWVEGFGRVKVDGTWKRILKTYIKANNEWKIKYSFDISFISNAPSGTSISNMPSNTTIHSTSYTIPSNVPVCSDSDYVFLGWGYVNSAGESDNWNDPDDSISVASNIHLYAQWYNLSNLEVKLTSCMEAPSSTTTLGDFSNPSATSGKITTKKLSNGSASCTVSQSGYTVVANVGYEESNQYCTIYGANMGGTVYARNTSNGDTTRTSTITKYGLGVKNRTGTSNPTGDLNDRILALIQKSEVCLRYSDLTVQSSAAANATATDIANYSMTTTNTKEGYSYICPVGYTSGGSWAYLAVLTFRKNSSTSTYLKFRNKSGGSSTKFSVVTHGLFAKVRTSTTTSYTPDVTTYGTKGKANYVKIKELEQVYLQSHVYTDFSYVSSGAKSGATGNYSTVTFDYTPPENTKVIGSAGFYYNSGYCSPAGEHLSAYCTTSTITFYGQNHGNYSKSDKKWYSPSGASGTYHILLAKVNNKTI